MKYRESMPLTSISLAGKHFLIGGGGGNPIFGFPNRIILLDAEFNLLSEVTVKEVVVSLKVYCDEYALVEYPASYELFLIQDIMIQGPLALPFTIYSPVILKDALYYIKEGKVFKVEISKLRQNSGKASEDIVSIESRSTSLERAHAGSEALETSKASSGSIATQNTENSQADALASEDCAADESSLAALEMPVDIKDTGKVGGLYTDGYTLHYKILKNSVSFLCLKNNKNIQEIMVDGSISSYCMNNSVGYIIQRPNNISSVTMIYKSSVWAVLEPMCIVVFSDGNGMFFVGTGTGHVIAYKNGVEKWRKKIFTSPVSSIACNQIGSALYCTCINGRVSRVSAEGTMHQVVKTGLFVVGLSACIGAAKYYAEERIQNILQASRKLFVSG